MGKFVQHVAVVGSRNRTSVGVFTLRPVGGELLTEVVVDVAAHHPGARGVPADLKLNTYRIDDEGSEYAVGTAAFVRFGEPQPVDVIAQVVGELRDALADRGCDLIPLDEI